MRLDRAYPRGSSAASIVAWVVLMSGLCLAPKAVFATQSPDLEAATAPSGEIFSTSPRTNKGRRWRVGYYEGGYHANYPRYLVAAIQGLMKLGWIPEQDVPEFRTKSTAEVWRWLSESTGSKHLDFVRDAHYSANWDSAQRAAVRKSLLHRSNSKKDLDLVIAMGTWAGQDLATDKHSTPTIVMSSSDPVGSGIIADVADSGLDHMHARVDPHRYERQVRVFHDIIGFKTLGVAYENSVAGKSYAAIDLIEKVAKERGFKILRCYTQSDIADQQRAGESVVKCFEKLAKSSDAIYVTAQGGVNSETIPRLVQVANRHRVPTFSQLGSDEVKHGMLLSISRAGGYKPVGLFLAATMAKVFNGARPRELNQIFEDSPNIAINLKTAELVGLYLYAHVLAAADEIYRDIALPK